MSYKAYSNRKQIVVHLSFARVDLNRPISLCSTFALLTIALIGARRYHTAKANALREIDFDAVESPEILSLHLGQNQG